MCLDIVVEDRQGAGSGAGVQKVVEGFGGHGTKDWWAGTAGIRGPSIIASVASRHESSVSISIRSSV